MTTHTYFFVGLGGSGMSAIAQYLALQGHRVIGSDRSFDAGQNGATADKLRAMGITIAPQDGSGVTSAVDELITSTAVEPSIADVGRALELGIPIVKRAAALARIHNGATGVAVGGTSGKSTVTGMIGHILRRLDAAPSIINGGLLLNALEDRLPGLGNVVCGPGPCVVEADESDGSIELYNPTVAVVTNITLDHKPLEELRPLFRDFIARATAGAVINLDCPETRAVAKGAAGLSFGIESPADLRAENIVPLADGVQFTLDGQRVHLAVPGRHNVSNALAAIAAVKLLGYELPAIIGAIASFSGIRRRLETVASVGGITIIDDFGHNPDKIAATLATLQEYSGRLLLMFQPHGFGPTRFLRAGLVDSYIRGMKGEDILYMPEIFYAGGTTTKDISAADLCADIVAGGRSAIFCPEGRAEIIRHLHQQARPGDRIVIMGARDDSLRDFCFDIKKELEQL